MDQEIQAIHPSNKLEGSVDGETTGFEYRTNRKVKGLIPLPTLNFKCVVYNSKANIIKYNSNGLKVDVRY